MRLRIHSTEDIPWTPLHKPLSEATVALVTTGGVHVCVDQPFDIKSDASYREIPRSAANKDLCITHDHYDRRDAIRDLNLVFPLERLLELEREGVIKRAAGVHYSFGFTREPQELIDPGRQVGAKQAHAGVDLVVLVPA